MDILEMKNVLKKYNAGKQNEVLALDNVSVSINMGDLIAIMGTSGSGKTTLLHILGGLDRPTEGEVLYKGEHIQYKSTDKLAKYRNKKIGFVLQDFGLLKKESVIENICVPIYFGKTKIKEAKSKAKDAAKMVGIEELSSRKVAELSGGQKQRVAIARALVNDPDVILADEPTGALDSNTSSDIMDLLIELNNRGKTIIIVTHDPVIASRCKKTIILKDGKIQE